MEQVSIRILRVVVASPGDVAAEREAVVRAADEVNRNQGRDRGVRLEVYRWETDAHPGLHAKGPQGLIDPILKIEDCDLLIGIFWKHFGTPTTDAQSGTEHEFRVAYNAWKQNGRPQVMVYFSEAPSSPKSRKEIDQWGRVLDFKENFPKEGLWWPYEGPEAFEGVVRNHLAQFVREVAGTVSASAATASSAGASAAGMAAAPLNALHSLPPPPPDFTGREAELAELRAAMEQGGAHISGLQGQGGVGKTALALKLAEALRAAYPEAQIYLDLRGASDKPVPPAEALAHVIRAFHPDARLPDAETALAAIYRSVLDGKRALLLMDNARDAAQMKVLVPPRSCWLLVTSRLHFTFSGLHPKDLNALPARDAEALLLAIEPRIDGQAAAIARLCGHLPQALRLAAGALAERSNLDPADYAGRLADEKRRLKELGGGEDSVEASINLSYGLLSPEAQKRWRMLGIFPDTFDARAAAALWKRWIPAFAGMTAKGVFRESGAEDLSISGQTNTEILRRSPAQPPQNDRLENEAPESGTPDEVLMAADDALGELLKYSMLEFNETARRYRLHDLMRDFARARLQEAGEENETARRQAKHYVDVLAQANGLYKKGGDSIKPGLALFDLEWGNIQAGQAWAAAHAGEDDEAARLCSRYAYAGINCVLLRQHSRDQIVWMEAGLQAARRIADKGGEGAHLGNLGLAYYSLGEYRRAIEYHERHLAIAREIGDRQGEGNSLGNLGNAYDSLGEYRRAIEYLEQVLEIMR
ncbi:MAG TPA: tetratricopeptide repeat protein, partial [Terriglobales bacterium]|nr:tetratricopeptide repeat protein [Terriglobales bacterium]